MKNRDDSKVRHVDPVAAFEALRESRRNYEGSKKGKRARKKWRKANRTKIAAYKRKWRRERRLTKAKLRSTAF